MGARIRFPHARETTGQALGLDGLRVTGLAGCGMAHIGRCRWLRVSLRDVATWAKDRVRAMPGDRARFWARGVRPVWNSFVSD